MKRVLLVDDDPIVNCAHEEILQQAGFATLAVTDGEQALSALACEDVDVIVSDIQMPVMSGLSFLKAVRSVDMDVPVVLVTAEPELSGAMDAVQYGAFRYLVKPIKGNELKETIEQALRVRMLSKLQRETLSPPRGDEPTLPPLSELHMKFQAALRQLYIAYQPIVKYADRSIFSYEALVRTKEESLRNPVLLFDAAKKLGKTIEIGRRIRQLVATTAHAHPDVKFFVNVNPTELEDDELSADSGHLTPYSDRVVLEITERNDLSSVSALPQRLRMLRSKGFGIAIDDLGAGYSSLSSFIDLEPDYVKVDMSLVRDVHVSPKKRALISGIRRVCVEELDVTVICEGVENESERQVLSDEGIDLMQGYLFARPGDPFPEANF